MTTCKRCKRPRSPWTLDHPSCSPAHWAMCIQTRDPMPAVEPVEPGDDHPLTVALVARYNERRAS